MLNKMLKQLVVTLGVAGFTGTALAGLNTVDPGPYTAGTGYFPVWYNDTRGATLELCLSKAVSPTAPPPAPGAGPNYMCTLLANPPIFDDALPIAFQANYPDEGFYFTADAAIDAGTVPNPQGIILGYGAAVEAAFGGGVPKVGDQVTFARIRIRADVPVLGTYTVSHPYGVETFIVDVNNCPVGPPCPGAINMTRDVGLGGPVDFSGALGGDIGPFLHSLDAPYVATNPDTGLTEFFIGDPNLTTLVDFDGDGTPETPVPGELVDHSPFGTNYVRIVGPPNPTVPIDVRTDLFAVTGKLYGLKDPVPLNVDRATYRRTTAGTSLEVFASAQPTATVTYRQTVANGTETAMTGDGADNWYGTTPTQPPLVVVTASEPPNFTPSSLSSPVTDLVKITTAIFDRNTGDLLVEATSSDEVSVPTLTALGVGDLTPTTLPTQQLVSTLAEPRATITVQSSAGGSDSEPLHVICSDCDDDGEPNTTDNCPTIANADQLDADVDGTGDACDTCTDTDGDTFGDPGFAANTCPVDNCPLIANANQTDTDGDSFGDACDDDDDNDGVLDLSDIDSLNPLICIDSDADTCDDCSVGVDQFGPLADNDPANDGLDTDTDGQCDAGDPDDDNDGVLDTGDNCPATPIGEAVDANGCALSQLDTDEDGVTDDLDNCTLVANGPTIPDAGGFSQRDTDGDGYGNVCDPDFNNSGRVDSSDYAAVKAALRSTSPDHDLNGSGRVDSNDLAVTKASLRKVPGPSALAP